ncbi:hypothetical protein D3C80_1320060 [compost metagenome]
MGGHQGADHQGDPDGDADAEGHAEVAHGEAIVDVADAPHGAKQEHAPERLAVHHAVEGGEVLDQQGGDEPGQQDPGEEAGQGPGRLPRPFLDLAEGGIEGGGGGGANQVPTDS